MEIQTLCMGLTSDNKKLKEEVCYWKEKHDELVKLNSKPTGSQANKRPLIHRSRSSSRSTTRSRSNKSPQ